MNKEIVVFVLEILEGRRIVEMWFNKIMVWGVDEENEVIFIIF